MKMLLNKYMTNRYIRKIAYKFINDVLKTKVLFMGDVNDTKMGYL